MIFENNYLRQEISKQLNTNYLGHQNAQTLSLLQ